LCIEEILLYIKKGIPLSGIVDQMILLSGVFGFKIHGLSYQNIADMANALFLSAK